MSAAYWKSYIAFDGYEIWLDEIVAIRSYPENIDLPDNFLKWYKDGDIIFDGNQNLFSRYYCNLKTITFSLEKALEDLKIVLKERE